MRYKMRVAVRFGGIQGVLGVWCISVVSRSFNFMRGICTSSRDLVGRSLDSGNTLGLVERNHEYLRLKETRNILNSSGPLHLL